MGGWRTCDLLGKTVMRRPTRKRAKKTRTTRDGSVDERGERRTLTRASRQGPGYDMFGFVLSFAARGVLCLPFLHGRAPYVVFHLDVQIGDSLILTSCW